MNYRGITVFQINKQIKAFMWHHNMLKDLIADIILFQADGFPENNNDGKITRELLLAVKILFVLF